MLEYEIEDFCIEDYESMEDTLNGVFTSVYTKEEVRQKQVEALTLNNREMKALKYQQLLLLRGLSDKEKGSKLLATVNKAHKGILEEDGALSEVLTICFDGELEELEFLLANRHTSFYKSSEVFTNSNDHPVQKELVKNKAVSLRGVKKSKTPHQHIAYMHSNKDVYTRQKKMEAQLDELQQRLALNERITNSIVTQQALLTECVVEVNMAVVEMVREVSERVKDSRKATAYVMLLQEPDTTYKAIADVLRVSERTIKRWVKEVKLAMGGQGDILSP